MKQVVPSVIRSEAFRRSRTYRNPAELDSGLRHPSMDHLNRNRINVFEDIERQLDLNTNILNVGVANRPADLDYPAVQDLAVFIQPK
jgi:hypothetical protein